MRGIILAAGKGRRITEITNDKPKSYLEIAGKRIVDHQIDALRSAGIDDICMVIGYRHKLFERDYGDSGISLIKNPFYDRTNVLGSVWFAREFLLEGFYFMHADTYYDQTILQDLTKEEGDAVLCVAPRETPVPEEMKVKIKDGNITEINKEMNCEEAYGEFIGLAKFTPVMAKTVKWHLEHRIENLGRHDDFFETVIQDIIDEGKPVSCFDIGERVAVEIDFAEDYQLAKELSEEGAVC